MVPSPYSSIGILHSTPFSHRSVLVSPFFHLIPIIQVVRIFPLSVQKWSPHHLLSAGVCHTNSLTLDFFSTGSSRRLSAASAPVPVLAQPSPAQSSPVPARVLTTHNSQRHQIGLIDGLKGQPVHSSIGLLSKISVQIGTSP